MTRRQLIPSRRGVKNFLKITFALGVFILSTCNFTTRHSLLSRHLSDGDGDGAIRNAEMFQITLTGVPDRLPTKYEDAYFEAILLEYLKSVLAAKDIKIYDVRVRSDKSIHYQRHLNEKFTVAGEKYKSNGGIDIDHATMIRVNENNSRVLGSAVETTVGKPMMHQLSLMVLIKGMYRDDSKIVFDSTVMAAINEGQADIQKKLTHSYVESSKNHEEKYFKDVEFVLCAGVGPRDKEPVLEMAPETKAVARSSSSEAEESVVGSTMLTPQQQLAQQEEEYNKQEEQRSKHQSKSNEQVNESDYLAQGKSGGATYSVKGLESDNDNLVFGKGDEDNSETDPRDPNFLRTSNSETGQVTTDTNEEKEPSSIDKSFELPHQEFADAGSDPNLAFNAEAVELRTVSGLIFATICISIGLMHLLRVIIKKNEDRRKRLHLAKKAYGGPLKESKVGQSSFYKSNKLTGTMDTGAGF